jgi:hypothetical protein
MKLVMSTAVTAVVLTLLATGLAEAENKNCTNVVKACRAEVRGGVSDSFHWNDRTGGTYTKVSECIRARGCVPQFPPRRLN